MVLNTKEKSSQKHKLPKQADYLSVTVVFVTHHSGGGWKDCFQVRFKLLLSNPFLEAFSIIGFPNFLLSSTSNYFSIFFFSKNLCQLCRKHNSKLLSINATFQYKILSFTFYCVKSKCIRGSSIFKLTSHETFFCNF